MSVYQIKAFAYKDEPKIFRSVVHTGEEEQYEVSCAFTCLNDLLVYMMHTNPQIIVTYVNGVLRYYIATDSTTIETSEAICGCRLKQSTIYNSAEELLSAYEPEESLELKGGIDPQFLDKRRDTFIDQLIDLFPRETFSMTFKLSPCDRGDTDRDTTLEKKIEESIEEIDKKGHLVDNVKTAFVGSGMKKRIEAETRSRTLLTEYYARLRPLCKKSIVIFYGSDEFRNGAKKLIDTLRKSTSFYSRSMRIKTNSYYPNEAQEIPIDYISAMLAFPMRPVYGLEQERQVAFGTPSEKSNIGDVTLGILLQGNATAEDASVAGKGINVQLRADELTRHAFVTGATGSGKTTTVKYLLRQLRERDESIPFLVLEPAKNEYRNISLEGVKVYDIGKASGGFKLNPFYFPENSDLHIQTHIDHIKSVFVAAFPMYGPMQYILETAIYNIYRKKGWDILTGKNTLRNTDKYPTLEDLLYEIDEATDSVGYSKDTQNDVKSALKVRIGSLITGAKGNMLNTADSDQIRTLLHNPSVMSLEGIGDSQEKVFLMGLILISIYEYYISLGRIGYSQDKDGRDKLKHLLVIEEAHRLLENAQANGNPEISDMKGKAMETFNNILSEIRAYGQGIVIADQIPAKLSPDIIKNTNIKIVHRLFAKDDREYVGSSVGLNEGQIDSLIRLDDGEAVVFRSGFNGAVRLWVSAEKQDYTNGEKQPGAEIKELFSLADNPFYIDECCKCFRTCLTLGIDNKALKEMIKKETREFDPSKPSHREPDYDVVYRKVSKILLNETYIAERIEPSFPKRLILHDRISEAPFDWWESMLAEYASHCSAETPEPKSVVFELFYPRDRFANRITKLSALFIKDGKFIRSSDDILRIAECEKVFLVSVLNDKQKRTLADCVICSVFQAHDVVFRTYFNVLDLRRKKSYPSKREPELIGTTVATMGLEAPRAEMAAEIKALRMELYELRNRHEKKICFTQWLPFLFIGAGELLIVLLLLLGKFLILYL